MKNLFFVFLVFTLFIGCTNNEVTKEDCEKQGKVLKVKKVLNFRTGKLEIRKECVN